MSFLQPDDLPSDEMLEVEYKNSLDNLIISLKSTRQQVTYITLRDIVGAIKEAFPEEYKLIAEKLIK